MAILSPMDYLERNYRAVLECMFLLRDRFDGFALPIGSAKGFDLVGHCKTDTPKLSSIRVICTETKRDTGSFEANLLISGGYNRGKKLKKHFDVSSCHYVFVWTPNHKYLIPTTDITQKKALILSEFERYIVKSN